MKTPTIDNIRKEIKEYKQHLDNGGLPVQMVLELHPGNIGLTWALSVKNPPPSLLLCKFTLYIKEKIEEAIKPPYENTNSDNLM